MQSTEQTNTPPPSEQQQQQEPDQIVADEKWFPGVLKRVSTPWASGFGASIFIAEAMQLKTVIGTNIDTSQEDTKNKFDLAVFEADPNIASHGNDPVVMETNHEGWQKWIQWVGRCIAVHLNRFENLDTFPLRWIISPDWNVFYVAESQQ